MILEREYIEIRNDGRKLALGYIETNGVALVRGEKAWARNWRPFFIQSGPRQIVGRRMTMGAAKTVLIASLTPGRS